MIFFFLFANPILSFWTIENINKFKNVDPYQVLGLGKDFTKKDLDKAYSNYLDKRTKYTAVTRNDEAISKQTKQSWEEFEFSYNILSNPSTRELYDTYGIEYLNETQSTILDFKGDEEIMMMKQMGMVIPEKYDTFGGTLVYPIEFSTLEFFKGATRMVTINTIKKCQCIHEDEIDCEECVGVEDEVQSKEIEVTIPPGAPNFYRVFSKDVFDVDYNRAPNDVIFVAIQRDRSDSNENQFKRVGNDIYTNFSLSLSDRIRGGTFNIKNIDGEVLSPVIDTSGTFAVSKGKGFPYVGNSKYRGDFIVNINTIYPTKPLSEEQRKIVSSILPDDPSEYE